MKNQAENVTLLGTVAEFVNELRARELAQFKLALAIALDVAKTLNLTH